MLLFHFVLHTRDLNLTFTCILPQPDFVLLSGYGMEWLHASMPSQATTNEGIFAKHCKGANMMLDVLHCFLSKRFLVSNRLPDAE